MPHVSRRQRAAARFRPELPEACEARALLSTLPAAEVAHHAVAAHVLHHEARAAHATAAAHKVHATTDRQVPSMHAPAKVPAATGTAQPLLKYLPNATSSPTGYGPAQVQHAYGFDQVYASGNKGAGQTIYIIDAYDDPTIASDLSAFSTKYGLPQMTGGSNPTFTKLTPQGGPRTNGGWALEISLDVEWAHAIAPMASIDLVEAKSAANSNLYAAIDYAVGNGAKIVSMSFGGGDASGNSALDSHFNTPGVSFIASAGDTGGVVEYPSASPYVLSVGGTNLPLDASGNRTGAESTWTGGGGGASLYEAEPGYQAAFGIKASGRGTPDVAYDADPNTGVSVYDTTPDNGQSGWFQVGGTSAGAPQWAALIALADAGRTAAQGPLSTNNLAARAEYAAATGSSYATNYTDITAGSNGYAASTGYDFATGLGTPKAAALVPWLAANG